MKKIANHPDRPCELCKVPFKPGSSTGKWCKQCIPDGSARQRAKMYGINQAQFVKIRGDQKNSCAICERTFVEMNSYDIHVDHCHLTGQIRGVLCRWCNAGIGYIQTINNARRAMSYMSAVRSYPIAKGLWTQKSRQKSRR